MRELAGRALELALLIFGVASLIQAVVHGEVEPFTIAGVLALGLVLAIGVRWRLRSSAAVWTWSLRWRYRSPSSWAGDVAASALKRLLGDDEQTRRAFNSLGRADDSSQPQRPLLAPSTSVYRRRGWGVWAFSTMILLRGFEVVTQRGRDGELRKTIRVTLPKSALSIYNNEGKKFLESSFAPELQTAMPLADEARHVLLDFEAEGHASLADRFPLRWASAGVLPIADWRGEPWAVLFFRDIRPTGWNIANGASENAREQQKVSGLAFREFAEELLVCTERPVQGRSITTRPFTFPNPAGEADTLESRRFSSRHRQLRMEHDGWHLVASDSEADSPIHVALAATPWRCKVVSGARTTLTRHIVPVVNPAEMGIEVVQVIRFAIGQNDVLLDGEILEQGPYLTRRPVALFRLEALREIFQRGALGEATRDRRKLPPMSASDVHVFTVDIQQRTARLKAARTPEAEASLIRKWRDKYAAEFQSPDLSHDAVRLLCPVTWKTLEAVFAQRVL